MQTLESSHRVAVGNAPPRQGMSSARLRGRTDDPRWQLALRIASSSSLGRSRLMVDFLFYVVDRSIQNRVDEITEQQIGVLVFGRPEGYDTNEDNIVRSYARNLRKRIDEYFTREGIAEDLLLEIPRGGYTPIFSTRPSKPIPPAGESKESSRGNLSESVLVETVPSAPSDLSAEQDSRESNLLPAPKIAKSWPLTVIKEVRKYSALFALSIGLILGISVASFSPRTMLKRAISSVIGSESTKLWLQLFSNKTDTFIVPSDDGLVIMQRLTERPVPLTSYVNGSYRAKIIADGNPADAEILKLGGRRYTSVVDLDLASHLAQLSEVVPERMMIRYARDLRIDDLRNGNAILIGSTEANPWIELFQPQMNFRFTFNSGSDKPSGILNLHPRAAESAIYGNPNQNHTYGLIAYVPNLNSTGHVLIVGGLNTAGTQAAATYLLTPSLMAPTLRRARLPGGGFRPFEVLIGSGNVASNASVPQMVLERIGGS